MAMQSRKVSNPAPAPETRDSGWRGWQIVALISLIVGLLVAIGDRYGLFVNPDMTSYDLLVKLQEKEGPSKNIVFVDFDEDTLLAFHATRLPRLRLANVVTKINEGKPEVIGLDVLLDEAREEPGDKQLVDVINKASKAGNVVIVSEDGFGSHPPSDPLPEFEKAATAVAYADMPREDDGSIRRFFLTPRKKRLPFSVALATLLSGRKLKPGGRGYLLFGGKQLPLATSDPDTAWIHFHPSPPVEDISVLELLKDNFDVSRLSGKIVMVGQSSEKGRDLFSTPVTRAGVTIVKRSQLTGTEVKRSQLTGTEVFAAATDTLLNDEALRNMHGAPRWILGLVLGFLVAACGYRHRWFVSVGACLLLVAAVFGLALYLFTSKHVWMPFISTEVCLLLALPVGLGYRSVEERRLKRLMEAERCQIMGLFERYVSPDVAAEIWKRRDQIILAGEERVATILFSDIRSFTAMTCGVPSKDVLAWLNRYLTAMGEVIKKNGGFLNKFIGDGIMVVFGAPLSESPKEDARRAVQCALEMIARLDEYNAALKPGGTSLNEHPMKIGIGIHTGMVTAGNVGSRDRLEYSVIGEAVNLASRLESLTKEFKTPIVISSDTHALIQGQFSTVSLGNTPVRGMTNPIPLYSVEAESAVEVHS